MYQTENDKYLVKIIKGVNINSFVDIAGLSRVLKSILILHPLFWLNIQNKCLPRTLQSVSQFNGFELWSYGCFEMTILHHYWPIVPQGIVFKYAMLNVR